MRPPNDAELEWMVTFILTPEAAAEQGDDPVTFDFFKTEAQAKDAARKRERNDETDGLATKDRAGIYISLVKWNTGRYR